MPEYRGQLRPIGRVGIAVSGYHERITTRLLDGALQCCREAGIDADQVDVVWVSGAFELGVAAAGLARTGRYAALVALGVVVRGDTPHFDYVAGETSRMLGQVAVDAALPVGFGLLTVDTMAQAVERAGGAAGNKGHEAAEAAIRAADVISQVGQR
ncbi:MAG: 6,7-dimethyl-8-ribityllumazine synthase [Gemmatimonadales bacterium]|nr:6,7-dimethyl-8-ribityllumazine synthase [Gemmatimonadota bacterium]MCC7132956.1 6,7-dimethyl-8-ribityllumazine synthase [Gemmatimonadales bacterium]MDX2057532.1 6,7-dimethyl-8-ribityllumazine synthase [Gemmatimonadales bacterium]